MTLPSMWRSPPVREPALRQLREGVLSEKSEAEQLAAACEVVGEVFPEGDHYSGYSATVSAGAAVLARTLWFPLWAQTLSMVGVLLVMLTWIFPSGEEFKRIVAGCIVGR